MSVTAVSAQVVVLASAGLLAVAILQKAHLLATGRAADEPVFRLRWIRSAWAKPVLAAAAAVELVVLVVLVLRPVVGLSAVAALMATYALVLAQLGPDESCGCLGEAIPMTSRLGIARNLVLAVSAVAAVAVGAHQDLSHNLFTQLTLGIALVTLAGTSALAHASQAAARTRLPVPKRGS